MPKNRCLYLGLENDPETVMAYPTLLNHCHQAKIPEPVDLSHQSIYCMTAAHRNCPVFLRSFPAPLPSEISAIPPSPMRKNVMLWAIMTVLVAAIGGFLLFGGWQWARANMWFAAPSSTKTPTFVVQPTVTPLAPAATATATRLQPSVTLAPQESDTPEPSQSLTETATPTPAPTITILVQPTQPGATQCNVPVGWVQYIVRPGDTLSSISAAYGISIAQLQAANCMGASTQIYTGQRLWVPNVMTNTPKPSATITPTPSRTPSLTQTPVLPTNTLPATFTPTNTVAPTLTPSKTNTPSPPTNTLPPTVTPSPTEQTIEL